MLNELDSVNAQFEKHVPYADAAFLVLKSHLVVEVRLLEFIKARVSPQLFTEIERPGHAETGRWRPTKIKSASAACPKDRQ